MTYTHPIRIKAVLGAAILATLVSLQNVNAVNFIKANNTTALNVDGSYTTIGVPGTGDTIVFNNTFAQLPNTGVAAGGIAVMGLTVEATNTTTFVLNGTMTLGAGGITKDFAGLIRPSSVTLSANQTWNLNAGTTAATGLSFRGATTITTAGFNLLVQGVGTLDFQSTQTLGSEVTLSNAALSIANNVTVTSGGANTYDSLGISNGRLIGSTIGDFGVSGSFGDGGVSTAINLGGTSTVGAIEYTGTTVSSNRTFSRAAPNVANVGLRNGRVDVSTIGQTLILTGNLGSASSSVNGGWNLGGNGNLTIASNLLDQGSTGVTSVLKFGNGTLTFEGANTYEGQTQVDGGTLLVNGTNIEAAPVTGSGYASALTGHYQVASGATLGGNGRIAGNNSEANSNMILVQNGGTLAPGDALGTLTLDGANISGSNAKVLNMASGAEFDFQIAGNGGTPDRVDFWNYTGGDLLLNSNAINLTISGLVVAGTYTVDIIRFFSDNGITPFTSGISSGLVLGTLDPSISGTPTIIYGTNVISLQYTTVPEPTTALLLAAGGLITMVFRRRRG